MASDVKQYEEGSGVSSRRRRVWLFVVCTWLGVAAGILGDCVAGDMASSLGGGEVHISPGHILAALIASPFAVTFGGAAVTWSSLRQAFFIGGLMFWPGYLLLAWHCWRKAPSWVWPVTLLWCAQGFFQLLHRYALIVSIT